MWVCQCTSRARAAHPCDVGVHARPVKMEADMMEGVIRVKLSANGIRMKSNKDNVAKMQRDELQPSVRFGPNNPFPIYQNAIFNEDERLA